MMHHDDDFDEEQKKAKELLDKYIAVCCGCGAPLKVHDIFSTIEGMWIDYFWRRPEKDRRLAFCGGCTEKIYLFTHLPIEIAVARWENANKPDQPDVIISGGEDAQR